MNITPVISTDLQGNEYRAYPGLARSMKLTLLAYASVVGILFIIFTAVSGIVPWAINWL